MAGFRMKMSIFALGFFCALASGAYAQAFSEPLFHSTDSLAPRDEWGFLHQMPHGDSVDFERRYHWRPLYWLEGKNDLVKQPAYIGALQRDLQRLGYYCGPIDGVYSGDVSDAIARLQKNNSMRVTGTITIPVRRALHLP
jgi:hypothetical protein